jgi:hypothetical protein
MIRYTPAGEDVRRKAAGADPDAMRYADAHRVMTIAQATPGIPFPCISRERATIFFVGITDPDEADEAVQDAKVVLAYALKAVFKPRQTVAHNVRHDILTAELPSGLFVDLVGRAQYTGGQDARADAPVLTAAAA